MNNNGKGKKSKKFLVWLIVGVLLIGAIGARFMLRRKPSGTEVTPKLGDITTYYSFSGNVEAKNRQTIYAERAMQIKDIDVTEGQKVKKDDVLMTTTMGGDIKADIDGEVSKINAEKDAQLMPGSEVMDLVDYSNLQLKVQVDEYDLSSIAVGKDTTVTVDALNKDVKGKVTDVSKEGIYQNGVTYFTATVDLPQDPSIRIGMSAEARILNQKVNNVVTLPMSVIKFDDNNLPYVKVKNGNKAPKRVDLELGASDGITVEIKKGITIHDTVLADENTSITFGRIGGQRRSDNSQTSNGGTGGTGAGNPGSGSNGGGQR